MAELDGMPVRPDALQALGLVNFGHFTSMRIEGGRARGLSHHLDRLARDCRTVFATDLDRERVRDHVRHAVRDEAGSVIVRVSVFDPAIEVGHPGAQAHPRVLVTTRPAGPLPSAPMRAQTITYQRDLPEVKHLGLFGALHGRRRAQLAGFDDALFVDGESRVTEGATWNIGFFDGARIVWPSGDVLPGVTMRLLQQVHEPTITAPVGVRDVSTMHAAFATNAAVGVRPVTAIDDMALPGDHPIFDSLREEYEEVRMEAI
ncbi:aminotransferase class IV family protein [Spongiactinospora sp. TRM90649]|uniref:aminotransferase class IV family protein n=1 Tax=Spongiactinospora sp. TRM90649 TaxID=3031114 RepID=UPI0023F882E6|nr:aminotransferase class IV family protein [Spongiactinospora sp. TRM90649]MDF5752912.1 aminotransferase class IV family protein [Spongiactinospora sp. TRM90649]